MTTPQQRTAIRLVVALLFAGLVLSTLAHPDTLWTGAILGVLYLWVARQLLAGAARAYRRVRVVSVLGFVLAAGQSLSSDASAWLRGVQVAQLVVLAALIWAVNRPVLRAAFPSEPDTRPRNRRAALVLVLLTPFVAEVMLGNMPLTQAWVALVYLPIYGAGALFLREVWRRTGGGLVNLLFLGVAYGLAEEGLALQSLTSPHIYGAAEWAPRLLGVNTAYTELTLPYHAVFSILIPIVLTELFFGKELYLRRGGLVAAGVVALLGAALVRVAIAPSEDPGYTMPLVAALVVVALIAGCTMAGLRLRVRPVDPVHAPGTAALAVATGMAAFAFLAMLWPFGGARQSLFTSGWWALLPMAGAALVMIAAAHLLRRVAWTERRIFAACMGALAGHTAFGLLTNAETTADRVFLIALALLPVAALFFRGIRTVHA